MLPSRYLVALQLAARSSQPRAHEPKERSPPVQPMPLHGAGLRLPQKRQEYFTLHATSL